MYIPKRAHISLFVLFALAGAKYSTHRLAIKAYISVETCSLLRHVCTWHINTYFPKPLNRSIPCSKITYNVIKLHTILFNKRWKLVQQKEKYWISLSFLMFFGEPSTGTKCWMCKLLDGVRIIFCTWILVPAMGIWMARQKVLDSWNNLSFNQQCWRTFICFAYPLHNFRQFGNKCFKVNNSFL